MDNMKIFKTLLKESSNDEKIQMLHELRKLQVQSLSFTRINGTKDNDEQRLTVDKDKVFRVTYEDCDVYTDTLKISPKIYDEAKVTSFRNIEEFLISVMRNDIAGNSDDILNLCIGGSVELVSSNSKPFHDNKASVILKNSSKYGHRFLFRIEQL